MRGVLLLPPMADDHHHHHFVNDWDLQAVVRSCGGGGGVPHHPESVEPAAAAPPSRGQERAPAVSDRRVARSSAAAAALPLPYDLEYLDLDHKPFLLPAPPPGDDGRDRDREVMISFPAAAAAAAASTSSSGGAQHRGAVVPTTCRKPGARTPRPKRSKKSQLKKVVREMPVDGGGAGAGASSSASDPWAWRKYGQKPIKGSPYPRGYYKCSSMKGCMARKLVERSPAKPGVLVVTYMADHCHPVPTQLNALAGTTRHKPSSSSAGAAADPASSSSPKSQAAERAAGGGDHEGYETAAATVGAAEFGGEAIDDDSEFWPAGMDLDELLAPVDDDLDFDHVTDTEVGVLERRLSL